MTISTKGFFVLFTSLLIYIDFKRLVSTHTHTNTHTHTHTHKHTHRNQVFFYIFVNNAKSKKICLKVQNFSKKRKKRINSD